MGSSSFSDESKKTSFDMNHNDHVLRKLKIILETDLAQHNKSLLIPFVLFTVNIRY